MGDMRVVDLPAKKQESNPVVIQRLKEALEQAEQGNIVNCALVLVTDDGSVMDCWANGLKPFSVVGGLDSLKFDFLNTMTDRREF